MAKKVDVTDVNLDILEKNKVSNGLLNRARQVGLALLSLGIPAARDRHQRLKSLEESFQSADTASSGIDLSGANRRVMRLGKFVSMSADGAVAGVAMTDPAFATKLPKKSDFESSDPSAFAQKVVPVLEEGDADQKAIATLLRGGIQTYFAAQSAHQKAQQDRVAAETAAENARLDLDAYVSDCLKFINDKAPKGHPAHQLKKPKRKPRAPSAAKKPAEEATETASPTEKPVANGVNGVNGVNGESNALVAPLVMNGVEH